MDARFTPTEGMQFRVDPILDANPIPGVGMFEWTFNGQPIGPQLPGVITGVDFLDFGSSIRREASGNYTITSFNEAGSGNASFSIDVLCKWFFRFETFCFHTLILRGVQDIVTLHLTLPSPQTVVVELDFPGPW